MYGRPSSSRGSSRRSSRRSSRGSSRRSSRRRSRRTGPASIPRSRRGSRRRSRRRKRKPRGPHDKKQLVTLIIVFVLGLFLEIGLFWATWYTMEESEFGDWEEDETVDLLRPMPGPNGQMQSKIVLEADYLNKMSEQRRFIMRQFDNVDGNKPTLPLMHGLWATLKYAFFNTDKEEVFIRDYYLHLDWTVIPLENTSVMYEGTEQHVNKAGFPWVWDPRNPRVEKTMWMDWHCAGPIQLLDESFHGADDPQSGQYTNLNPRPLRLPFWMTLAGNDETGYVTRVKAPGLWADRCFIICLFAGFVSMMIGCCGLCGARCCCGDGLTTLIGSSFACCGMIIRLVQTVMVFNEMYDADEPAQSGTRSLGGAATSRRRLFGFDSLVPADQCPTRRRLQATSTVAPTTDAKEATSMKVLLGIEGFQIMLYLVLMFVSVYWLFCTGPRRKKKKPNRRLTTRFPTGGPKEGRRNSDRINKLMKELEKLDGDDKSSSKGGNEGMVWTPWGEMLVTKSQFDKERDVLDPRLSQLTKMTKGGNNPLTGNPVLGAFGMGGAQGHPFGHSELFKLGMQQGMMGGGMQQPYIVVEESDDSSDESYDRRRRRAEKRHLRRAMRSAYYAGRGGQSWGAMAPMWIDRSY